MTNLSSFFNETETAAMTDFQKNGWHSFQIVHVGLLDGVRDRIFKWSMDYLKLSNHPEVDVFFNQTHDYVSVKELNSFRLHLIDKLSAVPEIKAWLYHMARDPLHCLVGNELAMQRALNLSIQLPGDPSSVLPLHSDVWSGNSPYEVVFWLPLVNCFNTKSMYVLPRNLSDRVLADFKRYSELSTEAFFIELEPDLRWMKVQYGEALLFSHSVIHGNRVNMESTTRWTMNVRFKSLLSPFGNKEPGESFIPITIRAATRVGYEYREPQC